jgi:N-succinyldiaminopimelate aminotransferase
MNPGLKHLHRYPFEKLRDLKASLSPPDDLSAIPLAIGEPRHPVPEFILNTLNKHLGDINHYPLTGGSLPLRQTLSQWLNTRFQLTNHPLEADTHVLPVNGTREALFSFIQCVINPEEQQQVLLPNPFYQIYEGATLLAGATPTYLNCLAENDFLPDFSAIDANVWKNCRVLVICTPNNPSGKVMDISTLQQLIRLSDEHNFLILSDECYSEIYPDENHPPPGLLQAAHQLGRSHYKNCVVFNSLSKRSNAPGLRSGLVAGDPEIIQQFLRYRTYHGCAMSPMIQAASISAWQDEQHVIKNRQQYREKFTLFATELADLWPMEQPDAGFFLWPSTDKLPGHFSDTTLTQALFQEQHITVLPGSYLSRTANGMNPGTNRVRMALVASLSECEEIIQRLQLFIKGLHTCPNTN